MIYLLCKNKISVLLFLLILNTIKSGSQAYQLYNQFVNITVDRSTHATMILKNHVDAVNPLT